MIIFPGLVFAQAGSGKNLAADTADKRNGNAFIP
jgi:hypothetical protein